VSVEWPAVLARLVEGETLSRDEARSSLDAILEGDVDPVVTSSFVTALTARGESADEMVGFVDAMMSRAVTFGAPDDAIDIVGTGGDRLRSVNISTMAALTVAGCGVPVVKHGNRAASSSVGTADVLEHLGVHVEGTVDSVLRCLERAGIGFCFAPSFHPSLRFLGPIRRTLKFPTVFNLLGPLANPASVKRAVIGVARPDAQLRSWRRSSGPAASSEPFWFEVTTDSTNCR
jgi:anthranilate phosphoribosyltransferase